MKKSLTSSKDHPRVCGEHSAMRQVPALTKGSSPRMRGALCAAPPPVDPARIIPAYAGSTTWMASIQVPTKDHPRVCGEHSASERHPTPEPGSSPRMRGALMATIQSSYRCRIIPAYAGSTLKSGPVLVPVPDHPRVCGEH